MELHEDRVLITGAAGFIGCHMADLLLKETNWELILTDSLDRGRFDGYFEYLVSHPRVSFFQKDLSEPRALEDVPEVSYVLHLAALVGVRNVTTRPVAVLRQNALGTFSIIDYIQRSPAIKNAILASTSEVYAGGVSEYNVAIPTSEQSPITLSDLEFPRTTYSLSKVYSECIFNMAHLESSVPTSIVRYHNVYGPRMGFMHVVPELIDKLIRNQKVDVFSPDHTRAFCFVQDAVEMTLDILKKGGDGRVFNVGNPNQEISMFSLAEKLNMLVGLQRNITKGCVTPGSPSRRCPDISRFIQTFGERNFVDLDAGLKKTYDWYRDPEIKRYE